MFTRVGVATVATVLIAAIAGSVSADVQVGSMKFAAPATFQETMFADGKVIVDSKSDLKIVAFIVKKQGSFDDAAKQVSADVPKSSLRLDGAPIKSIEFGKAFDSESNGVKQRWGKATIDGKAAQFAILQRGKETLFVAGIADTSPGKLAFSTMMTKLEASTSASGNADADPTPWPPLRAFAAVKDITASSTFADKSKKDLYGAWRVLEFETTDPDGYPTTAWCEGKPDEGIGEGITINFLSPTKIQTLQIGAGVWLTEKLFKANNQITSLAVSLDGGAAKKVKPSAEREYVEVPVGKAVSSIKITIDAVKKGTMNDSCISAVRLGGADGDLDIVRGLDAKAVAALPAAYEAVGKAIDDPKRAGLEKLVQFPFTYESSDWFFEGNQKPVKHKNWASIAAACKAKKPGCPSGPNTGGRDDGASVETIGNQGAVIITFPSRREVADQWRFVWTQQQWKLTDMVSGSP